MTIFGSFFTKTTTDEPSNQWLNLHSTVGIVNQMCHANEMMIQRFSRLDSPFLVQRQHSF